MAFCVWGGGDGHKNWRNGKGNCNPKQKIEKIKGMFGSRKCEEKWKERKNEEK